MPNVTRKNLSQSIAALMPRIIQGVQLEFLVKQTLTQTQFLVLVAIHSRGPCAMTDVANSMHVSMPTMSGIIQRLVTKGYVRRFESEKDRRIVLVELTAKGQSMIMRFQAAVSQRWETVLKVYDESEIEVFYRLINKLSNYLKEEK